MDIFAWIPDQGLGEDFTARVNKARFGDGYVQRSASGINNVDEALDLAFTVRTRAEVDDIKSFLKARKGVSNFAFTVPGDVLKKYTCETWKATYNHDTDSSITCKFERVFEA
jgi:phage-related protein